MTGQKLLSEHIVWAKLSTILVITMPYTIIEVVVEDNVLVFLNYAVMN